jgi:hypothetical protein
MFAFDAFFSGSAGNGNSNQLKGRNNHGYKATQYLDPLGR